MAAALSTIEVGQQAQWFAVKREIIEKPALLHFQLVFSCLWRIDVSTDSTGDRAAQMRRVIMAESSWWQ